MTLRVLVRIYLITLALAVFGPPAAFSQPACFHGPNRLPDTGWANFSYKNDCGADIKMDVRVKYKVSRADGRLEEVTYATTWTSSKCTEGRNQFYQGIYEFNFEAVNGDVTLRCMTDAEKGEENRDKGKLAMSKKEIMDRARLKAAQSQTQQESLMDQISVIKKEQRQKVAQERAAMEAEQNSQIISAQRKQAALEAKQQQVREAQEAAELKQRVEEAAQAAVLDRARERNRIATASNICASSSQACNTLCKSYTFHFDGNYHPNDNLNVGATCGGCDDVIQPGRACFNAPPGNRERFLNYLRTQNEGFYGLYRQ
jgi:hypothetical protein